MRGWVIGCSFSSSVAVSASPEFQTIKNSCANDASCPEGVCDGNICIDDSGASVDVAIEVLRDSSDVQLVTPASWAIGPESFSGSSTRDVVLPATREVRGVVRWDGLPVPATLPFRSPDGWIRGAADARPGRSGHAARDGRRRGTRGYDFSTVLVAGETYDVVVLPSSDMVMTPMEASVPAIRSLPPLYLELPSTTAI